MKISTFIQRYQKCQELLGSKGDGLGHDSRVFRDNCSRLAQYLKNALVNSENRGHLPWVIEVISKTCPFLMLPKRYEYLMKDLMKMLKGEEVDEYIEEEICFALNLIPYNIIYDD